MIEGLLRRGLNVNALDEGSFTPLHLAITKKYEYVVKENGKEVKQDSLINANLGRSARFGCQGGAQGSGRGSRSRGQSQGATGTYFLRPL